MIWLVIGSSPLAIEAVNAARAENSIDRTITCNRGIAIEPHPDYYVLIDYKASKMWAAQAYAAQKNGTMLVTLRRGEDAMRRRGVEGFDIIVEEGDPYERFQMSGIWMQEFAARNGATTVILAGMDGYNGNPETPDYFNAEWGKMTYMTDWTNEIIKPRCQLLTSKYPDVAWIQYGRPEYRIEAANWTVVELWW